jgi:SAM-dependent methyltransferase
VNILDKKGNGFVLSKKGSRLMSEPLGSFHLLYGYEPLFKNLQEMLKGEKKYGRDLTRRDEFVARGSGELCEQLPYQVMGQMIEEAGFTKVLDLGCGNGQFLVHLANRLNAQYQGFGIDQSKEAIEEARAHLKQEDKDGKIKVEIADMFQFKKWPTGWPEIEVITAIDVFHEYLYVGPEKIQNLFKQFKACFPKTALLVGEFCEQPEERLKQLGTSFIEHHFFHTLSKQKIVPAQTWRDMFTKAGYTIAREQVFDLVGHGYFLLK